MSAPLLRALARRHPRPRPRPRLGAGRCASWRGSTTTPSPTSSSSSASSSPSAAPACRTRPDLHQRLAPQILRQMIDERLQIQNAKGLGVTPTEAEINQRVAEIERVGRHAARPVQAVPAEHRRALRGRRAADRSEHRLGQDRAPARAPAGRGLGRRDRRRAGAHPRQCRQDRIARGRDLRARSTRSSRPTRPSAAPTGSSSSCGAARRSPPWPSNSRRARRRSSRRRSRLDPAGLARPRARRGDREAAAAPGLGADPHAGRLPHPLCHRPPPVRLGAARRRAAQPGADDAGAAGQRLARRDQPRHRRRAEGDGGGAPMQRPARPGAPAQGRHRGRPQRRARRRSRRQPPDVRRDPQARGRRHGRPVPRRRRPAGRGAVQQGGRQRPADPRRRSPSRSCCRSSKRRAGATCARCAASRPSTSSSHDRAAAARRHHGRAGRHRRRTQPQGVAGARAGDAAVLRDRRSRAARGAGRRRSASTCRCGRSPSPPRRPTVFATALPVLPVRCDAPARRRPSRPRQCAGRRWTRSSAPRSWRRPARSPASPPIRSRRRRCRMRASAIPAIPSSWPSWPAAPRSP